MGASKEVVYSYLMWFSKRSRSDTVGAGGRQAEDVSMHQCCYGYTIDSLEVFLLEALDATPRVPDCASLVHCAMRLVSKPFQRRTEGKSETKHVYNVEAPGCVLVGQIQRCSFLPNWMQGLSLRGDGNSHLEFVRGFRSALMCLSSALTFQEAATCLERRWKNGETWKIGQ